MSERQGSRDGARPGADPLYAGWVGCWSSLLFFSSISGFPPSAKTSTFNFQFDQNRGPAWKPAKADVASSLNIVIYERPLNICDSNIYMLFAGLGSVRMVKNCDRGLENAARGRCSKLVLQITNGFVYATLVTESASAPSTNDLQKSRQRASNSDSRQIKMY